MAVFRVERNSGYTVMSNHHLRNKELTFQILWIASISLRLPSFSMAWILKRSAVVISPDVNRRSSLSSCSAMNATSHLYSDCFRDFQKNVRKTVTPQPS